MNMLAHELCLEEDTLSGALERPLHHKERVLETVARWGYWDPEDRKDNVLILKKDRLYKDIVSLVNIIIKKIIYKIFHYNYFLKRYIHYNIL